MVQSLLETKRRGTGKLIQFGSAGADGAREATWTQPANHPDYIRPENSEIDLPKQWIFQVKFHDIGLRGWSGAGSAIIADLKSELEKVTASYELPCHHYVMITNVPLTGARHIGTRDKIAKICADWEGNIPCVEVWDSADLSRMLDNNPEVRSAYSELILPGDVLSALHNQLSFQSDRRQSSLRGYLKHLIDNESKARAEEAGDDDPLPLHKVFIDQTLKLDRQSIPDSYQDLVDSWGESSPFEFAFCETAPDSLDEVSCGFPLLWGAHEKVMLQAGPGYGKSTITQFLALFHAGRILKSDLPCKLAMRLKLPNTWSFDNLDAHCAIRFPFRIELRRYAKWRKAQERDANPTGIATYIAQQLIGGVVESTLNQDDIFALISDNPTLVILDGLDEVPNKDDRDALLKDCESFFYRCSGEDVDLQVVMSSRPQGYHGEFDRFQPLRWEINELTQDLFDRYSSDWLTERVKNPEERVDAEERIRRGMTSDAVRRLATTLLQATVMLTIVRKKNDIPEERHKLFEQYVEVVFQREKTKNDLIAKYENELKLLHEMVGYQIHEAMAQGNSGVMPEHKFKSLVWDAWRLIRGDEKVSNETPNQQIHKIYELSTDRLVFLSGKGSQQSDIDFIIQPYREYFAASYMSNHGDADPDQVFKRLVERGPFWQQVLRFFVAMAMPQQRLIWALDAASSSPASDIDSFAMGVRDRRAVTSSLAEFGRLQFNQFRKIMAGCFPENEFWTWLGQDSIIPTLEALRSGEAWQEIWRIFRNTSSNSFGSSDFVLSVLSAVIPPDSTEFPDFLKFVLDCISNEVCAKSAIEAVACHNLPVNFALADQNILFNAIRMALNGGNANRSDLTKFFLKKLPRPLAIRFFCTFSEFYRTNVWAYLDLPVEESSIKDFQTERSDGFAIAIKTPTWLRFSLRDAVLPIDDLGINNAYGQYISCLHEAIRHPEDSSFYFQAAEAMAALPEVPALRLQCKYVLGPSPNDFWSVADWSDYKSRVRHLFSENGKVYELHELAATFGNDLPLRYEWLVLLFQPSQWHHLAEEDLINDQLILKIRNSEWAKIAAMPKVAIGFASSLHYTTAVYNKNFPILKILRIAVTLHNNGQLLNIGVTGILYQSDISNIDLAELRRIIASLQRPSEFPARWARHLFGIALANVHFDLTALSNFWEILCEGRKRLVLGRLILRIETQRIIAICEQFVSSAKLSDMRLLSHIFGHREDVPLPFLSALNRMAASRMREDVIPSIWRDEISQCLFYGDPSLEEARLYCDCSHLKSIIQSNPRRIPLIVDRIEMLPQTVNTEDLSTLRIELGRLISNREHVPPRIGAAALEALIQLDVAACLPMTENLWKSHQ